MSDEELTIPGPAQLESGAAQQEIKSDVGTDQDLLATTLNLPDPLVPDFQADAAAASLSQIISEFDDSSIDFQAPTDPIILKTDKGEIYTGNGIRNTSKPDGLDYVKVAVLSGMGLWGGIVAIHMAVNLITSTIAIVKNSIASIGTSLPKLPDTTSDTSSVSTASSTTTSGITPKQAASRTADEFAAKVNSEPTLNQQVRTQYNVPAGLNNQRVVVIPLVDHKNVTLIARPENINQIDIALSKYGQRDFLYLGSINTIDPDTNIQRTVSLVTMQNKSDMRVMLQGLFKGQSFETVKQDIIARKNTNPAPDPTGP